jgi:hypothetical protein
MQKYKKLISNGKSLMITQENVLVAPDFQPKEIILNYKIEIGCRGWKPFSRKRNGLSVLFTSDKNFYLLLACQRYDEHTNVHLCSLSHLATSKTLLEW